MIAVQHTTRSYSGRIGCMCGCNGTYNEGKRARKMAITALLKDPAVRFHAWDNDTEGCIFVETGTRNRVLYLNAQGIMAVRAMGLKEEK